MSGFSTILAPIGGTTRLLPPIISGTVHDAIVTPLSSGAYVATYDTRVWSSFLSVIPSQSQLFSQVYNSDGAPIGETAIVDPVPGHWIRNHFTIELEENRFAVIWGASTNYDTSPPSEPPVPELTIFAQLFDADGSAQDDVKVLFDARADDENAWLLDAVVLADGRIAVLWNDFENEAVGLGVSDTAANQTVSIYNPDFSGPPTTLPLEDPAESLSALPDGGFVIEWNDGEWTDGEEYQRSYDAEGTATGPSRVVPPSPIPEQGQRFSLTELVNGNQLALWSERVPELSWEVRAQLYDATGSALGETIEVHAPSLYMDSALNAVALDNGGFTVAWKDRGFEGRRGDIIRLQNFDELGEKIGPAYTISDTEGSTRGNLTGLSDGDAVLRFGSYGSGSTMDGADVRNSNSFAHLNLVNFLAGTPGDYSVAATEQDDNLTGGPTDDTINALDGNDTLRGLEGDDILNAGDGTDTIKGGPGNDTITGGETSADRRDTIFGGDGNDSIDAGHGNDLVYGQGGNDTIAGGFGADELFGQNGDDVITGSAFSDLIFGGDGDDYVNGGFGFDRLNGGAGADMFYHAGVRGHGTDWIQDYSAAEGDVLVFRNSFATPDDFQVNFTHTESRTTGERSGNDEVEEAFVIYKPTGQIIWALIDGGGQEQINIQIGGDTFDLLA